MHIVIIYIVHCYNSLLQTELVELESSLKYPEAHSLHLSPAYSFLQSHLAVITSHFNAVLCELVYLVPFALQPQSLKC